MKKTELRNRWQNFNNEVYLKRIFQYFAKGGAVSEYLSPFRTYENRIDFRGLEFPVCSNLYQCRFEGVDFTHSTFSSVNTDKCFFENVLFDECDFSDFRDLHNQYLNCSFIRADLLGAGIGLRGSSYTDCLFKDSKFRRTGFVRPEYNNCVFENCKLKSANFNASSFESCVFIGKLHGVAFSNGYFLGPNLNEEFGAPRENRMCNVSFARAELKTVCYRFGCDLSTVIMPENGNYRRYDRFAKRLQLLQKRLNEFPERNRKKIEDIFLDIYLRTAINLKQDMYILNCDEICNDYGEEDGQKIIDILDSAI